MKTTEENRTMNSGDRREPGDVYMMLSPEGKTQAVSANGRYYKNFGHFINHCTEIILKDWLTPYPNSFFVHYRFADPDRVWKPYENIPMFPRKLSDAIKEQGLKPLDTCRLYPAKLLSERPRSVVAGKFRAGIEKKFELSAGRIPVFRSRAASRNQYLYGHRDRPGRTAVR